MIGFGKMHGYKTKVAGLVIAGAGIAFWAINSFAELKLMPKMTAEQQGYMIWWIVLFGLYMAAFSKEKNDDERVKAIRAKSMLVCFNLSMAVLMSMSIVLFIEDNMVFRASDIIIVPTFCIVFYLLMFHVGLYFDNAWDYKEDTNHVSLGKGKTGRLYLVIVLLAALVLGYALYQIQIRR